MRARTVIGVRIHQPTSTVFRSLAYSKVPVNLLASTSLLPPVFQAIRKYVVQAGQPVPAAQAELLFDEFNEGGFYKLWTFKMFRDFIEFHCLVNPSTRNQWYLVRRFSVYFWILFSL